MAGELWGGDRVRVQAASGRAAALIAEFFYTLQDAPSVLRGWRELIAEAPRQATLIAWTGTAGDWAVLPKEHHNSPLASVGYIYVASQTRGASCCRHCGTGPTAG